jgi:hypothetical protein
MAAPFPRLIAAHFASPGLCFAKPLFGLAKRRKQPERYAQLVLFYILNNFYYSIAIIYNTISYYIKCLSKNTMNN